MRQTLPHHSSGHSSGGFTLVEMLMSLLLFSIAAFGLLQLIQKSTEGMKSNAEINEGLMTSNFASGRIQYELGRLKTTDLTLINTNKIGFIDQHASAASFEFDSSSHELRRTGKTLLTNVQNVQFSYLDANGSAITSLSNIQNLRTIQWTITFNLVSSNTLSLTGRTFLRSTAYAGFQ